MENEKPVDKKKLIIRIVAFSIAAAIAVFAFAYGMASAGKKSEGFQLISAKTDGDSLFYASGITFMYYCQGSSDDIKHQINEIQSAYSAPLSSIFKQTDNKKIYAGYSNIATLCQNPGVEFPVSAELYGILKDAFEKTAEGRGYNMFSGALNAEWEMLLFLDDAAEFDPSVDQTEGERIKRLAEMTSDMSNFALEFGDGTVKFSVSKEYTDFLSALEITSPVIDLGLLREAYELEYVTSVLKNAGYKNGYFYTDSGLLINLGADMPVYYGFLGYDGESVNLGYLTSKNAGACAFFKAFITDAEEYNYYTVSVGGKTFFRHPYYRASDGLFSDVLMSSMVYSEKLTPVDLCYINIALNNIENAASISDAVLTETGRGAFIAYTVQGDGATAIIVPSGAECFTLY